MPDTDPLKVTYSTLADLKHQLADLSLALDNTRAGVTGAQDHVATGAGELSGQLAFGAAAFALAWSESLAALADGAALVSNNAGQASLDFEAVDVAYSSDIQL